MTGGHINEHFLPAPFTPTHTTTVAAFLLAVTTQANDTAYKQVNGYKIFYSAFNSSFIQPEIASIYKIVRGKDKGIVNIAVVPDGETSGKTAQVSGYVSNIFAQQQFLEFLEVREQNAVYYLAPFEFENEDPLTFKIEVRPASGTTTEFISFQRTFYHEE